MNHLERIIALPTVIEPTRGEEEGEWDKKDGLWLGMNGGEGKEM